MKTRDFWKAAMVRAVRTMAQTALGYLGGAVVLSEVQWGVLLSASLLGGILSLVTSIATGLPEVEDHDD